MVVVEPEFVPLDAGVLGVAGLTGVAGVTGWAQGAGLSGRGSESQEGGVSGNLLCAMPACPPGRRPLAATHPSSDSWCSLHLLSLGLMPRVGSVCLLSILYPMAPAVSDAPRYV